MCDDQLYVSVYLWRTLCHGLHDLNFIGICSCHYQMVATDLVAAAIALELILLL